MPSVKEWLRYKRNTDLKSSHLEIACTSPEYILPLPLSMTNDTLLTLESRSYSFSSFSSDATKASSSTSSGVAEMMDDENTAWGPQTSKSKSHKPSRK